MMQSQLSLSKTLLAAKQEEEEELGRAVMASSKVVLRLSSRLQAIAPKLCRNSLFSEIPSPKVNSRASLFDSATRIGRTSRLPVELSSQESLMPLHSAIASARLVSSLTIESQSWGLVPQGISMPL